MSQTPPKSDKQLKAERLQAALRDNLRRRKQAGQGAAEAVVVTDAQTDHENGTPQDGQK